MLTVKLQSRVRGNFSWLRGGYSNLYFFSFQQSSIFLTIESGTFSKTLSSLISNPTTDFNGNMRMEESDCVSWFFFFFFSLSLFCPFICSFVCGVAKSSSKQNKLYKSFIRKHLDYRVSQISKKHFGNGKTKYLFGLLLFLEQARIESSRLFSVFKEPPSLTFLLQNARQCVKTSLKIGLIREYITRNQMLPMPHLPLSTFS